MPLLKDKNPEKSLTFGYVATLFAIATFAGLAVFVQNRYMSVEEKAANAMALMSRQQFHVQEIALATMALTAITSNEPGRDVRKNLDALADQVLSKHNSLMQIFENPEGFLWDLEDTVLLSAEEIESYKFLDPTIKKYVESAKKVAAGDSYLTPVERRAMVDANSEIIQILDSIQESYALERKKKVTHYKNLQIAGYSLVLFVILLAGLFVFRPIARHVRATRLELEKSTQEAEKASQIKTDFLTNISHEIRTPLSGIIGFVDMLLCDPDCSGKRRETVFSIKRSAKHLKTLIDDILDLSKVEAGTIEIGQEEFDLISVIHEIKSIVGVKMKDKGLDFSIQFQTEIPEYIESDPKRMIQILVNVLGNATKFTDKGQVDLKISAAKKGPDQTELVFTVSDTGCGIAPDKTKKLFKRFSQVDSSLTRKTTGTGLGLALSKHLANLLGGDLFLVSSKVEVGSTFRFRLGCSVPEKTKLVSSFANTVSDADDAIDPKDLEGALAGVRVLLVEDGHDNQRVYNYFLKLAGAEVHSCWDGLSGLEYGATRSDIDVILMDIQLPKMDGYTVTNELRIRGVNKPIVALTAHAMQQEKERCLSTGFDDYISKPVSIPILIRTVKKFARPKVKNHNASGIDRNGGLLRSKYHDKKLYVPMILEFVDTLDRRIAEMRQAIESTDWHALEKAAHKVKGAASTYGYPSLTEQAGEIESFASSATDGEIEAAESRLSAFAESCKNAIAGARELRS